MSFIQPDGVIVLMKGVPLPLTYEHTILFESASEQAAYFASFTSQKFDKQSYTRPTRGILRVQLNPDDARVFNYLRFQNTHFSPKWFYAFITNVEYINHSVCEIQFSIDVLQTWMFDYELKPCFVEREHSATDEIGDNLLPEPVDANDYVYENLIRYNTDAPVGNEYGLLFPWTGDYDVIVWATFDKNLEDYQAQVTGNMFNGLCANVFTGLNISKQQQATTVNNWIQDAVRAGKEDGIVSICMIPSGFITGVVGPVSDSAGTEYPMTTVPINFKAEQRWVIKTYDGDIPIRNNKLFTYPYTFIQALSNNGDHIEYKYEKFGSTNYNTIYMNCVPSPSPQAELYPYNYEGIEKQNYTQRLTINDFPQCAYNTDAYKAWLAQNNVNLGIDAVRSVVNIAASLASFKGAMRASEAVNARWQNPVDINGDGLPSQYRQAARNHAQEVAGKQLSSGANFGSGLFNSGLDLVSTWNQWRLATIQPPVPKGNRTGSLDMATHAFGFYLFQAHVTPQLALAADTYFTKYGYSCQQVKVPGIKNRSSYTYVKTNGCFIMPNTAGLDSGAIAQICSIFDRGLTFWRYKSSNFQIGNYDQENTCTGNTGLSLSVEPTELTLAAGETKQVKATVTNFNSTASVTATLNNASGIQVSVRRDSSSDETGENVFSVTANATTKGGTVSLTLTPVEEPNRAYNVPVTVQATPQEVVVTVECGTHTTYIGRGYSTNVTVEVNLKGTDDNKLGFEVLPTGGAEVEAVAARQDAYNPGRYVWVFSVKIDPYAAINSEVAITFVAHADTSVSDKMNVIVASSGDVIYSASKDVIENSGTLIETGPIPYYMVNLGGKINYGGTVYWARSNERINYGSIGDPSMQQDVDTQGEAIGFVRSDNGSVTISGNAVLLVSKALLDSMPSGEDLTITYPKAIVS